MVLGYERGALDLTQPVGCTKIMLTENEKNKNSQPLRAIFLLKSVASSGTMQVSELQLSLRKFRICLSASSLCTFFERV